MWTMQLLCLLVAIACLACVADGQEAVGACKDVATVINRNDTKSELIQFNGNITIFAMLNSSLDKCIERASMINDLHNQLLSSQYYQMNFVILDTIKGDQPGDRQRSQSLLDVSGNVTVLANAKHNITGVLKSERDYILVINRCGRQIFQMIDPCSVECSDLKTAIFTTFYDNVYQFCGECHTPYAKPIEESIQHLHPDFYKNIENCGNLTIPQNTTEFNSTSIENEAPVRNDFSEENTSEDKDKIRSSEWQMQNVNNTNQIHRSENSNEASSEKNKAVPINIHLDLPNIHTINYKITKHSHAPGYKGESNISVQEETIKNGKMHVTVHKNWGIKNHDDSVIETQYFNKKSNSRKDESDEGTDQKHQQEDNNQQQQSIEETLYDNIIEFSNGTSADQGFKLTNRHALYHLYSKMLPKLRQLLDQQKSKKE